MKAKDLAAILLQTPEAVVQVCNPDAESVWYPVTGALYAPDNDSIELHSDEA